MHVKYIRKQSARDNERKNNIKFRMGGSNFSVYLLILFRLNNILNKL